MRVIVPSESRASHQSIDQATDCRSPRPVRPVMCESDDGSGVLSYSVR